jgi:hypothetical protein
MPAAIASGARMANAPKTYEDSAKMKDKCPAIYR